MSLTVLMAVTTRQLMRALAGGAVATCAFLTGCAGAHYELAADHARYPISFSPALPDATGRILYLGHELESKGSFEFTKTQIGFLYSAISSGPIDVSDQINEEVAHRGGEGVVALALRNQNCVTNYLFPLQILPFYPGCQIVTVTGTVIGVKGQQAPVAAPLARMDQRAEAP